MNTQTQTWIMLALASALIAMLAVSVVGGAASMVTDAINADLARIASGR